MPSVQAIVLAGGPATRLGILSDHRTEAAAPFAGKYRLIDFTLSNLVNSGIFDVAVLTQYRPHSLNEHIGIGRPWDLDRQSGGIQLLQPYLGRDAKEWHRGPADAVYHNWRFFDPKADFYLILMGDHVYKMDYRDMIREHQEKRADVTLAVTNVPAAEAGRYGIVSVGRDNRVTQFWEKPSEFHGSVASMGVYLFNHDTLWQILQGKDGQRPYSFGADVFPSLVEEASVYAHPFLGYFVDVGTLDTYWGVQMAFLGSNPPLDLYDAEWVIHTRSEERPPVKSEPGARIHHSLVANGCQISGDVEYSILSPGVVVEPGAVVRQSIILTDTYIGAGAVVEYAVIDKQVNIGAGAQVGESRLNDARVAADQDPILAVVGKRASIAPNQTVAPGATIAPDATVTPGPFA